MGPITIGDLLDLAAAVYLGSTRSPVTLALVLIGTTAAALLARLDREEPAMASVQRRRGHHGVRCWENHPDCALRAAAALTAARRDHHAGLVKAGTLRPAPAMTARLRTRATRLADAADRIARDGPDRHAAAIAEARQLLTDEHQRGRN